MMAYTANACAMAASLSANFNISISTNKTESFKKIGDSPLGNIPC